MTSAPADDEDAFDKFVRDNLRRNYTAHFLHGCFGMTGFRLVSAPTFVPAYLHSLSASDAVVGLGLSLQQLGGILSPIIGASQIEHRKRILPVSVRLGLLMRIQVLGLALSGWLLTGSAALGAALFFLFLLGVFQGPQRIAFQFLLAKVIPVQMRGRLQAWRNVIGGLIAAALSYVAGLFLVSTNAWGNGYAATFFLAFVLTSIGLILLQALMREPSPPSVRERTTLRERLRDFPALLREDRGFAWFMVARTLGMGTRIAQPFFFLYAATRLGVSADEPVRFGALLALLSLAYMGADTLSNLLWGYLADRGGFLSTFLIGNVVYLLSVALLFATMNEAVAVVAFFGLGLAQSAYVMATTNIVMEFGHRHDIPMRMALSNTAEGVMGAAAPLAGALLALTGGYPLALIASAAAVACALLVGWLKVDEPRRRP
jgi:MFS family permease